MAAVLGLWDWLGLAGAVLLIMAYGLVARRQISPESSAYILLSLTGAAAILTMLLMRPARVSLLLDALVLAVALIALSRFLRVR